MEEAKTSKPGFVYFAYAPEQNRCKIGWTARTPEQRLGSLTDSSVKVNLWGMLLAYSQEIESKLHFSFRHLRLNGEWFFVDDQLRNFVQNHAYASLEHFQFVPKWNSDKWRHWERIASDDQGKVCLEFSQVNPVDLINRYYTGMNYFYRVVKPHIEGTFGFHAHFRDDPWFKTSQAYDLVYEMCCDLLPR